jgi:lathosterol oxidase
MDIALELSDTFFFDYVYAALLPAQPAPYNLANGGVNSTQFDWKASSPWQYESSTKYLSLTPRDAAYMSQWTRDNIYRQLISLFFITW